MDEISSDYEKDMEANWAIRGLENEVLKAQSRYNARRELLAFLEANPPFKRFYEMTKAVDRY